MSIQVGQVELFIRNMRLRMPFKYGIATLTAVPHLLVRLELRTGGESHYGLAADHLPAKWFTKDPNTTFEHDVEQMIEVIDSARRIAQAASPSATLFDHWRKIYDAQSAWAGGRGIPPLLAHFGTSFVERAMIDAWCRSEQITFADAARRDRFGIKLATIHPELDGTQPGDFLPPCAARSLPLRQTIGMSDPLTDGDIPLAERVDDGLPQSLEASIRAYGLRYLKIKLLGDLSVDLERIRRIAEIIGREAGGDYLHTVDANEQFRDVEPLRQYWSQLVEDKSLAGFFSRLIFVEQPLHRDVALGESVRAQFAAWPDRPPLIIDESDAELTTSRRALDCGYAGTSHKNCKGVFKSIANACLLEHRRRTAPGRRFLLSAEDLTTVGPVSLQQDLTVVATLGVDNVERNGHHYFRGLSMLPAESVEAAAQQHADVYTRLPDGTPAVRVERGQIAIGSVVDAPFGLAAPFEPVGFTPASQWKFQSLQVSGPARPASAPRRGFVSPG